MSNAFAIAAVTATLRNLLQDGFNADPDLPGVSVTTRPPDKARGANDTASQVNLFLYRAAQPLHTLGKSAPSTSSRPFTSEGSTGNSREVDNGRSDSTAGSDRRSPLVAAARSLLQCRHLRKDPNPLTG